MGEFKLSTWLKSVIGVNDGRGFVVSDDQENRLVVTAAHCLPHLAPATGASYPEERLYTGLLGSVGDEPSIAAQVLFVDPVNDIANLGSPDNQAFWREAEAYEALVELTDPLPLAKLNFKRKELKLSSGQTFLEPPKAEANAWLLSLEGEWFPCLVTCHRGIWISNAAQPIMGGMSGSPIMVQSGVIGILGLSDGGSDESAHCRGGPQAYLPHAFPGWMLARRRKSDRPIL